jgi:hypothetical protein
MERVRGPVWRTAEAWQRQVLDQARRGELPGQLRIATRGSAKRPALAIAFAISPAPERRQLATVVIARWIWRPRGDRSLPEREHAA